MKSFFAALRSLVLPFGATSGARIVLDGVNGRIQVFNTAGVQIGILDGITGFQITGTGETFRVQADGNVFIREVPDVGAYLQLTAAAGFGGLIFFQPENSTVPGLVFFPAAMYADALESLATNSQPKLQIASPYVTGTPNKAQSQVILKGQTNTSASDDSSVNLQAGQVNTQAALVQLNGTTSVTLQTALAAINGTTSVTLQTALAAINGTTSVNLQTPKVKINGVNNGTGWIDGDGFTASKGPFGATEAIILTTFQQTWKANTAYRVEVTGIVSISAVPNKPNIRIRQSSDGTTNLGTEITNAAFTITALGNQFGGFTCKFKVGGADVTCFIVATLQGTAGFTVTGVGTPPFMFDVYSIGDASNHSNAITIT